MSAWIHYGDGNQNVTHNLRRMFDYAFEVHDWYAHLDGKIVSDVLPDIDRAILRMVQQPEAMGMLEASNGWGTYDQALPWLISLRQSMAYFPEELITIHQ